MTKTFRVHFTYWKNGRGVQNSRVVEAKDKEAAQLEVQRRLERSGYWLEIRGVREE